MSKKILLLILTLICILPIVFAGLESSDMSIGVKRNTDIGWYIHSYSAEYPQLSGYYLTWAIVVDVDKSLYTDNPFVDYAYLEEYEWYNPPFLNNYDHDKTPILIATCLVISDEPDEPRIPVVWKPFDSSDFLEEPLPYSSLEMWVDIGRGFMDFKDYEDAGGDYTCWEGGFTTYCYLYLDEDYMTNEAVIDYYGWNVINPPNLKDVADIDLFSNCDEDSEGSYCMVNIHYPWNVVTDVGDTSCTDDYWWYGIDGVGLWNATPTEFNDIEDAEGNLDLGEIEINNQPSDSNEAGDAGGGGEEGEGTAGYQYTKVQGYLIETEIAIQQQSYLNTILNIMKLLFSFLLLIFYIIEFAIIIYIPTKVVPSMYNKLLDVIKKAGNIK